MDINGDLRKLHEGVYSERPMSLKYGHRNPLIKAIELKRLDIIEKWCRPYKGKVILDVGCEEGYLFSRFSPGQGFLVGIDFLEGPLKRARKHSSVILGDAQALPIRDKSVDVSVCSETLEHVEEPRRVLKELDRVTKGKVILSVPDDGNTRRVKSLARKMPLSRRTMGRLMEGDVPEHVNAWDRRGFENLIGEYFIVEEMRGVPRFPGLKILARCRVRESARASH
jgi:SAM-dependent methyltransferase